LLLGGRLFRSLGTDKTAPHFAFHLAVCRMHASVSPRPLLVLARVASWWAGAEADRQTDRKQSSPTPKCCSATTWWQELRQPSASRVLTALKLLRRQEPQDRFARCFRWERGDRDLNEVLLPKSKAAHEVYRDERAEHQAVKDRQLAHACNPGNRGAEAGGSSFKASLGYTVRPCLNFKSSATGGCGPAILPPVQSQLGAPGPGTEQAVTVTATRHSDGFLNWFPGDPGNIPRLSFPSGSSAHSTRVTGSGKVTPGLLVARCSLP
jgi:hypothetical protein